MKLKPIVNDYSKRVNNLKGTHKPRIKQERCYKKAVIVECNGTFMARVDGRKLIIDSECFPPRGGLNMYSKPCNELFESYTRIRCTTFNKEALAALATRYSLLKPDLQVEGCIKDDIFHVLIY